MHAPLPRVTLPFSRRSLGRQALLLSLTPRLSVATPRRAQGGQGWGATESSRAPEDGRCPRREVGAKEEGREPLSQGEARLGLPRPAGLRRDLGEADGAMNLRSNLQSSEPLLVAPTRARRCRVDGGPPSVSPAGRCSRITGDGGRTRRSTSATDRCYSCKGLATEAYGVSDEA